jgi:WD40 repeat protein
MLSSTGSAVGRVWDAGTGALKTTLQGHTGCVYSVAFSSIAFSPCGSTLASGSWDHSIRLWDAGTGTLKAKLQEHTAEKCNKLSEFYVLMYI